MQIDKAGAGFQLKRALLLYVGVLSLLFCDVLFLGRTLDPYPFVPGIEGLPRIEHSGPSFCNDAGAVVWAFQPWNRLIHHEIFDEGEIPLWNPYQATGVPLAANFQSGVFSPLQWPFFLSPSQRWWDFLFVLRLLTAGMFTFLFLRRIGLDFVPSWYGGLAYMLCGYFVDYIDMNHIAIPLLLPAAFFFAESWRAGRRPGYFLGTVASLALLILGGMPESTLFAGFLFGSFLIYQLASERRPFRDWLPWGWVLLLVMLVSGVLLVPALEYLQLSHSKHFTMAWGTVSFLPEAIITFLVPFFFGAPGPLGWHPVIDKAFNVPSALGVVTVALAITGFLLSRNRLRWFFGLYALLAVVKLFGPSAVQSVGYLPVLRWLIFTKYLQPSLAFCTAVLAALGLAAVRERSKESARVLTLTGVAAAACIAGWLLYFLEPLREFPLQVVALAVLGCAAFGLAVASGLSLLGWMLGRGHRHVAPAIFLLASIEIVALGIRIHPVRRPPAPQAEFVDWLRERGRQSRIVGDYPLFPNTASAVQLADLRVLDPILPERLAEAFTALSGTQLQSRLTFREFDDYEDPALDVLGVRFVVSGQDIRNLLLRQRPQTDPDTLWTEDRTGGDISLVELGPATRTAFRLPSRCDALRLLVRSHVSAGLRLIGPDGSLGDWTVSPGFAVLGPTVVRSLPARSPIQLEVLSSERVYVAVTPEYAAGQSRLVPVGPTDGRVRIFERPDPLPLAFLTDSPELLSAAERPEEIPGFAPDPDSGGEGQHGSLPNLVRADDHNRVRLVHRTANRIEFAVQADHPGHLFVSQTYFPGWSAEVSGAPVPLERAGYFMSAVPVPAGSSPVVLRYRPGSVRLGLVLTLFGLILTLGSAKALSSSEPTV